MPSTSEWWGQIVSSVLRAPLTAMYSIHHLYFLDDTTTLFLIQNAASPNELLSIISDRKEQIIQDNECLAQVRLLTSKFLLTETYHCVQRLEKRAASFRTEASSLLSHSSSIRWTLGLFRAPMLIRAQKLRQQVTAIQQVIDGIHQFIGMHIETLDDIRVALRTSSNPGLARGIVTSCRQASSFMQAVSECKRTDDLQRLVNEAVRTSLHTTSRRNGTHPAQIAGQLGQFWTQGSVNAASNTILSSHEVSLMLQILQSELSHISIMSRRLRKAVDRDFSLSWDIQRRPVRYTGLTAACMATARSVCIHARFLGGDGLLEDKMTHYSLVCRAFISNNVYIPVVSFYQKVFSTDSTAGNEQSIADARLSLRKMLIDYTETNLSNVKGADKLARDGSMKAVMDSIAEQARHPLRNSVVGSLAQAMLLQVQKLKCDVDELMLKSKQLLKAQELNLAIVALVPAMATAAALMYISSTTLYIWRSRGQDLIVSGAQTVRFLLGDIHSTLVEMEGARGSVENNNFENVLHHVGSLGALHTKIFELEEIVDNDLIRLAPKVRMRFFDDMNLLRSSRVSLQERKEHIERMLMCYQFIHDA